MPIERTLHEAKGLHPLLPVALVYSCHIEPLHYTETLSVNKRWMASLLISSFYIRIYNQLMLVVDPDVKNESLRTIKHLGSSKRPPPPPQEGFCAPRAVCLYSCLMLLVVQMRGWKNIFRRSSDDRAAWNEGIKPPWVELPFHDITSLDFPPALTPFP